MRKIQTILMLGVLLTVAACHPGRQTRANDGGDTIPFKYARLITAVRYAHRIDVSVADPWHEGKILHRYVLSADTTQKDDGWGTAVRIPLQRAVVASTVHCSLLEQLGALETVAGVCDLQYVNLPEVKRRCETGRVKDCGSSMQPDAERIIETEADAVLLSPFENSGGYGKLEQLGVPLIECADYMEATPLGRAEWMRFYGMLTGREREADSLFHIVEARYNELKTKAAKGAGRPTVMADKMTGSVWYVPGGQSTIGQMLADAAGSYVFADEKKSGSLALTFEDVMDRGAESELWILRYSSPQPLTYAQLVAEHKGYGEFAAFKHHKVYGCNTLTSLFFEQTPFRPDWLLDDFVTMFHPEFAQDKQLRYFHPLE